MDVEEARTIGRRLREVRFARGKSLRVVAGLAGISPSYLSRLESGERALDRRSLIVALANALQIAPSELTTLPMPAPGHAETVAAVDTVRRALLAVSMGVPGGQIVPVEALRSRVHALVDSKQRCRHAEVGLALPGLVADLHSSLAAGYDDAELLRLAALLHVQGTQAWLHTVGAAPDLCWAAATLARGAARRLAEPVPLGIAAFGAGNGLLATGDFDLATIALEEADGHIGDDELSGMLALTRSLVAAAAGFRSEVEGPLDLAADLAERTGEGNAHYLAFGPTNVILWRISVALEAGEYEHAAALSDSVIPRRITQPTRQANYWTNRARALTRLRRREDAVAALRNAERIAPATVYRNPFARETLAELLARARRDAVGRELRGMAYRAGLPV